MTETLVRMRSEGVMTSISGGGRGLVRLEEYIRDVPDYPTKGILFKDITPLLRHPAALALAVELMTNPFRGKGINVVVGTESRGFIFGTAIAQALSAGFVPVRKAGKLPMKTHRIAYGLEYGKDTVEIHLDAVGPGDRVLMVDDLLATGGTLKASCDLIEHLKAQIVGISVLIELEELNGRVLLDDPALLHAVLRM